MTILDLINIKMLIAVKSKRYEKYKYRKCEFGTLILYY